jgi:hypothetical protein
MSCTPDNVAPAFARGRLAKPAPPPDRQQSTAPGVCAVWDRFTAAPDICPPAGISGATYRLSAVRHG